MSIHHPFNNFLFEALIILYALIRIEIILHKRNKIRSSGIKEIDAMKGIEFEEFLKLYFEEKGYKVKLTATTADYGCDLLIKKNGVKTAVQAKRYSSKVGIRAVQEVIGSIKYYKVDKGLVVTNNYFTNNAKELASINQIDLWDRDILIKKLIKKK